MQTELAKDVNSRQVLGNLLQDCSTLSYEDQEEGFSLGQIGLNKQASTGPNELFKIPQMTKFEPFSQQCTDSYKPLQAEDYLNDELLMPAPMPLLKMT